jgi:hypothetical protein
MNRMLDQQSYYSRILQMARSSVKYFLHHIFIPQAIVFPYFPF